MEKNYFIKLCLGLYRVTDLFPSDEPLKFFLREKADEILSDSILIFLNNPINLAKQEKMEIHDRIIKNTEIIQGYLEISEAQNWVNKDNFTVLEREYERTKDIVYYLKHSKEPDNRPEKTENKPKIEQKQPINGNFKNERSKKILDFLKSKEKAQIWEFKQMFPDVTKRTLRRDFEFLLANGYVDRIGEGKYTYYRLKSQEAEERV